jgi:hypothetical protein
VVRNNICRNSSTLYLCMKKNETKQYDGRKR